MQPAVRYSPDVETVSADEAEVIRGLSDALRDILETTSRDYGHAVRAVHAKSHGIIRGELEILRGLLPQVQAHAPEALIVLVTNPVDVLTLVAQRLTGLPAGRVIGSGTLLDTSRLRWLLASRAQVHASSVHAAILGEHGDTEFPAWSSARIGPTPLLEWPTPADPLFTRADLDEVADTVVHAAYEVIQGKGATTYAVGVATTRLLEAILRDQHAILPVSTVLDGVHGLSDVALSMPSVVGRDGVTRVIQPELDDAEMRALHASADALRREARSLGF